VVAGQEGIALSEETTRSARDIALVTQQQRKATERVHHSMDAMAGTMSQATTCTRQAASVATDLVDAVLQLDRLVGVQAAFPPGPGKSPGYRVPVKADAAALSQE
jgi:methyl-accepting chemotaxis protein